jgi:hypothetical protein
MTIYDLTVAEHAVALRLDLLLDGMTLVDPDGHGEMGHAYRKLAAFAASPCSDDPIDAMFDESERRGARSLMQRIGDGA